MTLTTAQQEKVEKNIGLVHKVIHDKVHGAHQVGCYVYEDLFQIGCVGLCKAAATDKGGTFSTYAYRLIWNEICDVLIYATRRQGKETACDAAQYMLTEQELSETHIDLRMDIAQMLCRAKVEAPPSTAKGIDALQMMAAGYKSREIGEQMGASDKLVCAWVSKARKFLRKQPELQQLME